jgi:hypothetical protein
MYKSNGRREQWGWEKGGGLHLGRFDALQGELSESGFVCSGRRCGAHIFKVLAVVHLLQVL